jgi:ATP-dependent DNA helicase RecQ
MAENKFYINCPFTEKAQCKELGAKWDAKEKKWYVPDEISIDKFTKWIDKNPDNPEPIVNIKSPKSNLLRILNWREHVYRRNWEASYLNLGGIPFAFKKSLGKSINKLYNGFGQILILKNTGIYEDTIGRITEDSENKLTITQTLKKILLRGYISNSTIKLEEAIIRKFNLNKFLKKEKENSSEVGWNWDQNILKKIPFEQLLVSWLPRNEYNIDKKIYEELFDSHYEVEFLEIISRELNDKSFLHWFTPQASLDTLIQSDANRRVDFLFAHPFIKTIVIEIDGEEHKDSQVDRERDLELNNINIKTFRIPNDEIQNKGGVILNELLNFFRTEISKIPDKNSDLLDIAIACNISNTASHLQYLIIDAIDNGFLDINKKNWHIYLDGDDSNADVYVSALLDIAQMVIAVSQIYKTECMLKNVILHSKNNLWTASIIKDEVSKSKILNSTKNIDGQFLKIHLDKFGSSLSKVENEEDYHYILKPVCIPGILRNEFYASKNGRKEITEDKKLFAISSTTLLNNIFRKRSFFSEQIDPIIRLMQGRDTIVLLPTGSGKSLIYQFSGLMMPGITLVIDPIIALIKDQEKSMIDRYGIEKVKGISSADNFSSEEKNDLQNKISSNEFFFLLVSPERLQNSLFRETLREISFSSYINLVVIDEAHCVSEWGHDFRPSYLHLPNNLRKYCKSSNGDIPPLACLTGTASRAVLKDMLIDVGISNTDSDAVIRPKSFDRKEIKFRIIRNQDGDATSTILDGFLKTFPKDYNSNINNFYRSKGRDTASGIIFVPTVKGKENGILAVQTIVKKASNTSPLIFSGSSPFSGMSDNKWSEIKFENMDKFLENEEPILIATKAFGMGIDKPNIRYTIHYGMPGSLESFYQEAGRAGRDKKPSLSLIIFNEYDEDLTNKILDPNLSLEEMKELSKNIPRSSNDDLSTLIFFHTLSFKGIENEIKDSIDLIDDLGDFQGKYIKEIPMGDRKNKDTKDREKVLVRLLRVGVVEDYEVDRGSNKYIVTIKKYSANDSKKTLLDYVIANQPGIRRAFQEILDNTPKETLDAIKYLTEEFIKFTYDHIEKSRRGMIREAIQLARTASSDLDIRKQILSYLQEGLAPETIEEWLKDDEIDLEKIKEFVGKNLSPTDASETRGTMIRLLESYPTHPVLLIIRALTEGLINSPDENQIISNIEAGYSFAVLNYKINEDEIVRSIEDIWRIISENKKLNLIFTFALHKFFAKENITFNSTPSFFMDEDNLANRSYNCITLSNFTTRSISSRLNEYDMKSLEKQIGF